jgi:type I restriction enzyme S subunit
MSNKWNKKPLKDLCFRIGDGIHGTPNYKDDTDIYFINGNNLKNGRIEINKNTRCVSNIDFEKNYIKLDQNSLLLSINGTLGSMAFYNNENVMLGKSAAYLNFKNGIVNFYYYYFQLEEIQKQFYKIATGSTIKNLSLKSLQEFKVPIPKEEEWVGIAQVLSSLDSKIELNNRINQELESIAKLLYDYWFVQFDFPNEHGKPYKRAGGKMVYNEELKREIPEGWEVKKLSEITEKLIRGISPKYVEEGIPVINQKCIRNTRIDFNLARRHNLESKVDSKLIKIGDVLVNSTGVGTLGRVALVKRLESEMTTVDSHVTIVRCDNSCQKPYFGFLMLDKQREIERFAEGSTGQVELSRVQLGQLNIVIPPYVLQTRFTDIIEPILSKIARSEEQNQQLTQLRDWLLPMLMNGQLTVKQARQKVKEALDMVAEPQAKYK